MPDPPPPKSSSGSNQQSLFKVLKECVWSQRRGDPDREPVRPLHPNWITDLSDWLLNQEKKTLQTCDAALSGPAT